MFCICWVVTVINLLFILLTVAINKLLLIIIICYDLYFTIYYQTSVLLPVLQISLNKDVAKVLPSLGQFFTVQILVYSCDRVLLIQ